MIVKPRNTPFKARMGFDPDTEGVGVQIVQFPDVIVERTTTVTQIAPGVFEASLIAPSVAGDYAILWDANETEGSWRWQDLRVTTSLYVPGSGDQEDPAPATVYTTAEEVHALNVGRRMFTETSQPNLIQVEGYIEDIAAILNAVLADLGYTVPVPAEATEARGLLNSLNTLGAAWLVEEAAPTSDRRKDFQARWEAQLCLLKDGHLGLTDAPRDISIGRPRSGFPATAMISRDMEF